MLDAGYSLSVSLGLFALAATVIGVAGVAMTAAADRLADRTGLGEAVIGAALLGGTTSLSGMVTSVSAASQGHGELAVSNAIGGIAAQTAFLVIADIAHRRANLEHAAASITNITHGALLISLLSLPLIASAAPEISLLGIHPVTIAIFVAYGFGLRLASATHRQPMWWPRSTNETKLDVPEEAATHSAGTARLLCRFALLALCVAIAGYVIAEAGIAISRTSGLSQTVVGALMTAVATSLPELITTIAAVRRGALTLAVGGIIGGNTFDVLLVALSDMAYRPGSVYHVIGDRQMLLFGLTILMTAVLLIGLIRREKHGVANIGFESALIVLIYAGGVVLQLVQG